MYHQGSFADSGDNMKYIIISILILFTLLCVAAMPAGADAEKSFTKSDKSFSKDDKSFSKCEKSFSKDDKSFSKANKTACCPNYPDCPDDCPKDCPKDCPGKDANFGLCPKKQQKAE